MKSSAVEEGIRLALHNDAEEIVQQVEGRSAYEYLLDACEGLYAPAPIGLGEVDVAGCLRFSQKKDILPVIETALFTEHLFTDLKETILRFEAYQL